MSNKTILWIIILVIAVGLIAFTQIFNNESQPVSENSPSPTSTLTPTLSPTPTPTQSLIGGGSGSSKAAACQLSGLIRFIDKNLYETIGAKIKYQNVDDITRQIFWKSNPDDSALSIGPNLFEQLVIPNGEREVGVALTQEPTADIYRLTAAITYGIKNQGGAVEEKIANCTGEIKVEMP